jgi:hypothetical protein
VFASYPAARPRSGSSLRAFELFDSLSAHTASFPPHSYPPSASSSTFPRPTSGVRSPSSIRSRIKSPPTLTPRLLALPPSLSPIQSPSLHTKFHVCAFEHVQRNLHHSHHRLNLATLYVARHQSPSALFVSFPLAFSCNWDTGCYQAGQLSTRGLHLSCVIPAFVLTTSSLSARFLPLLPPFLSIRSFL